MVSALDVGLSDLGLSPGQGLCVVFLGKTCNCHIASYHSGVQLGGELNARGRGNPVKDLVTSSPPFA